MASRFVASWNFCGISSQVKLEIGYAVFPGALVMETRKSSGMSLAAPAAAARYAGQIRLHERARTNS